MERHDLNSSQSYGVASALEWTFFLHVPFGLVSVASSRGYHIPMPIDLNSTKAAVISVCINTKYGRPA